MEGLYQQHCQAQKHERQARPSAGFASQPKQSQHSIRSAI